MKIRSRCENGVTWSSLGENSHGPKTMMYSLVLKFFIQNLRDCLVIENESKAINSFPHSKQCDPNMKHIRAERSPIGILTLSRIILKNLTYCVLKIQD